MVEIKDETSESNKEHLVEDRADRQSVGRFMPSVLPSPITPTHTFITSVWNLPQSITDVL